MTPHLKLILALSSALGLGALLATAGLSDAARSSIASTASTATASSTCGNSDCTVEFPRVPLNKQFIVTNGSCRAIASSSSAGLTRMVLQSGPRTAPALSPYAPIIIAGYTTFPKYYAANHQILHPIYGGDRPTVTASSAGGTLSLLECTIAGQLVDG
jgi:hypothetical protein